jgi:protein-disulfide isomerase
VETGQVKMVFWPVLNHGNPSVFATLTAHCVGLQDPALFWPAHDQLFANQADLFRADRDYYVALAAGLGADQATFEACYDDGSGLAEVMALDDLRRQRGVFGQPTFDVNGQVFAGLPAYDVFQEVINAALTTATP